MGKKGLAATIDVYVRLPSGKTTQFDLPPSDTVQTIHTKISAELGVSQDRLQIKYQGKVLKKIHSLGYLGVCRETILKAEVIELKRWTIYVKLPSGETIPVELDNLSPVRRVKEHIKDRDGIAFDRQVLKISNRKLEDMNQRAMDAGITNEAILTLEVLLAPVPPKTATKKKSSGGARADANEDEYTDDDDAAPDATPDGVSEEDKQAIMGSFDAAGRNVEVVFSFDTTGSMSSCLNQVRTRLKDLVRRLLADIPNIRIGLIAHGDYCDYTKYVVKAQDLTTDVDALVRFAKDTPSTGGGDAPEAYEWVLHVAQRLEWSESAAKALVVIGDQVPHAASYTDQRTEWHAELDVLTAMGVKVYGVQAMNDGSATNFYRELAERTGGAYVKFTAFSVIADMFMAVCYREAAEEQLQNFQDELEAAPGGMTEEVRSVLQQIQDAPREPRAERQSQRYVAAAWWDPSLDHGSPQYSYDAENDTWGPYTGGAAATPSFRPGSSWVSGSDSGGSSGSSSGSGSDSRSSRKKGRSLKSRLSFRKKKSGSKDTGTAPAAAAAPAETTSWGRCSLM